MGPHTLKIRPKAEALFFFFFVEVRQGFRYYRRERREAAKKAAGRRAGRRPAKVSATEEASITRLHRPYCGVLAVIDGVRTSRCGRGCRPMFALAPALRLAGKAVRTLSSNASNTFFAAVGGAVSLRRNSPAAAGLPGGLASKRLLV